MMNTDWKARHRQAMEQPGSHEIPLVLIMRAIEHYVRTAEEDSESDRGEWRDYVLGPAVGDLLDAFVQLLNGPTGRLDCGTLDTWARSMAERIGYNMDTNEYGG